MISMKKIAKGLAVISIIVFVIAWCIMGVKLLDHNYLITIEAYIGLVSLVVLGVCAIYIKITDRCPHCGKTKQSFGKYCPYCGKEITYTLETQKAIGSLENEESHE